MDFSLTPEHELIRESAYKFGQTEILPGLRERDREAKSDREILTKMGQGGMLGVCIPESYGGMGADYISLGIACEELERADTSARVVLSVHNGLHSMTIMQWGTEEQKQRWLPKLATGERVGGFGLTEPNAGSDAANLKTTARRDGDHYVINGQKAWISLSDYADQFLVITKLVDGMEGMGGMDSMESSEQPIQSIQPIQPIKSKQPVRYAAFIVDRNTPGFSSRPIHGKLGVRAGNTGAIFFEDMRVHEDDMLGQEGDGFKVAMSALDHGRYTVASGAVGIITACLDACVKYANERTVQGEAIGKKQLVQQMIASMVQGREIGRLLYYKVGWMKNTGQRHTKECGLAKWVNCAAAFDAANKAVEIHGAYGFCDEFPVERYFRNSRGAMIYEGTHEIHTIMQAEYELGYRSDKPLKHVLPTFPFA